MDKENTKKASYCYNPSTNCKLQVCRFWTQLTLFKLAMYSIFSLQRKLVIRKLLHICRSSSKRTRFKRAAVRSTCHRRVLLSSSRMSTRRGGRSSSPPPGPPPPPPKSASASPMLILAISPPLSVSDKLPAVPCDARLALRLLVLAIMSSSLSSDIADVITMVMAFPATPLSNKKRASIVVRLEATKLSFNM